MDARAWKRIDEVAQAGHGALRRADGLAAGFHPRALSRVAGTQWSRPHRGVFTLTGTRNTFRQEAAAALLAVGPRALLTGEAALHLYEVLARRPALVELVVPATARPCPRSGVRVRRTRAYDAIRPRIVDGLRGVHPARALADFAEARRALEVARAIARAVALRRCTLEQAGRELAVRKRFPGRRGYAEAVRMLRGELTHSDDEQLARRLLREAGVQPFPRPFPIEIDGRIAAEADIAIIEVRYDIEIDGPHHDLPEQVKADKARDRHVGRGGWTVDRFPVELVRNNPRVFVREVLARVAQLRAQRR